mgnify:FL=1
MSDAVMLFRDPLMPPAGEALSDALPNHLLILYHELQSRLTGKFMLELHWRYYQDGKAWLCKIADKKKTVCWLSLWQDHIKVSFYFTERSLPALISLDIPDEIKEKTMKADKAGKLIPCTLSLNNMEQLQDLERIITCKRAIK